MRLVDYFDKGASLDSGRPFASDTRHVITFGEAREASYRIASVLEGVGLGAGARVATLAGNSALTCQSIVGLLRAGCAWVTAANSSQTSDIVAGLKATNADALLFSADFDDRVGAIVESCPNVRFAAGIESGFAQFPGLLDSGNGTDRSFVEPEEDPMGVATVFGSGGTSGLPKGVMMTGYAWEILIASASAMIGHQGSVRLMVSPLMQTAGAGAFLMDLSMGTSYVILDDFDPGEVLRSIEEYGVTHVFLPPAAISLLVTHPDARRRDYSSLRFLTYGGAPIAPEVVREAMSVFGSVLTTGFAQTETGGPVTHFSPAEHADAVSSGRLDRLASCGKETRCSRVEIMDDSGVLLPPNQEGEIVVKSGHLMAGYCCGGDSENSESVRVGGWHRTGDIGRKDRDGYLYIVDRKREMIITRGTNVFPAEVERILEAQPGVAGAAVVGAPHQSVGEVIRAVIEVLPGAEVDTKSLRRTCRHELESTKVPVSIEIWPSLPRSSSGKVLRREVRDAFWKNAGTRI